MQVLHKHLKKSSVNTKDGEQAKVFYIPVYLGRYFNAAWQKYSDPSDAWFINKECHGLDLVDCWAEKWIVAENVSCSDASFKLTHKTMAHIIDCLKTRLAGHCIMLIFIRLQKAGPGLGGLPGGEVGCSGKCMAYLCSGLAAGYNRLL